MGVKHRFLELTCSYGRDLNSSEVLLVLRDVYLREGRHVGPSPREGPLATFQDLVNNSKRVVLRSEGSRLLTTIADTGFIYASSVYKSAK